MTYTIEGDYFEGCNCTLICRCGLGGTYDGDACDVFFAWHIGRGAKDGIDLADLNVALARHRPRDPDKDRWQCELFIDERATPQQARELEAIFSGAAGGRLEVIKHAIGPIVAVHTAPIRFDKEGRARRLRVGEGVLELDAEELIGLDGENPTVITNFQPSAVVVPEGARLGRAQTIRYRGGWKFDASNTNSFINEFRYQA